MATFYLSIHPMDNLQQEHPAKLKSGGNGWQSLNQELIGNDVRTISE